MKSTCVLLVNIPFMCKIKMRLVEDNFVIIASSHLPPAHEDHAGQPRLLALWVPFCPTVFVVAVVFLTDKHNVK